MNRPLLKILVVDDDEDDFYIIRELFDEIQASNIQLEWAPNYQKGLDGYLSGSHHLYFVDYLMGVKTGIDFLKECRNAKVKSPVIMITGKGDFRIDKLAMAEGAADYLVKGELDAEKLERSVRYSLDRYEAGKRLAESEAKYRNVFENSRDIIFIADKNGKFLDTNNSCMQILQYTKEELLEMKLDDLFESENNRIQFKKMISDKFEIVNEEQTLLSKSGQKKICLISSFFQQIQNEEWIIQGVIRDITKRRKAENDLATAEKLAVTGRVVRMIGHEVRNPLTNINLSLEQIESETEERDDLKMLFDIIRRNSERINGLITELLNSSKPAQLNMGKVSINTVVQNALDLIRDRITLKHVKLIKNFEPEICDINIDEGKVEIAILNILVNAVEAVEKGAGVLEVTTRAEDEYCVVEICDNGIGIPTEAIDRIFDPFFSAKPKGTGLGLSTTHNIVRSHNGSIDVTSVIGKGTCFTIKFNFN